MSGFIWLLFKIFLLMLASAIGGYLLRKWLETSRYEDVTISYTEALEKQKAADNELARLNTHYLALQGNIENKLDDTASHFGPLQAKLDGLDFTKQLSDLSDKLNALKTQVDGLPTPKDTDLTPVLDAVSNIRIPEPAATDLSPALSAIKSINIPDYQPTDVQPVINEIRQIQIPEAKPTDLSPVMTAIENIRIPEHKLTDLSPVMSAIDNIRIPEAKEADLTPILDEIKALKAELSKRPTETKVVQTVIKEVPSQENQDVIANRLGDRGNRLRSAAFGKPDDLKTISGVGPKLEKMLHGIGVYYFWQVADWSPADVQEADDLLDAFKGRIERDEWVKQAGKLAQQPTASRRP